MLHPSLVLLMAIAISGVATYVFITFIAWFAKSLAEVLDD